MPIKHHIFFLILTICLLLNAATVSSQEWRIYNKENSDLPTNNIFCVAVDDSGNKWFGTDEGLVHFDDENWKLVLPFWFQNFTNKDVNDVVFETKNNQSLLWVATEKGVSLLDISDPDFPVLRDTFNTTNSGLIDDGVKALTVDPGYVSWFGTFKGLSSYYQNTWGNYSTANYWIEHDNVVALESGPDSMVYIGTEGGGVSRLKIDVDGISSASPLDKTWTGADEPEEGKLTSNNVYSILIEQNGYQWFGTDEGVALHTSYNTKRDWKNYTIKEGLIDNFVQAICKENETTFWFGTPQGVSKFDGLSWKNYTTENGLASNNVRDIAIDDEGTLWFVTENGITVLAKITANSGELKSNSLTLNSYPNPFNLLTSIEFTLSVKSHVKIDIYNLMGQHILTLSNENLVAGKHHYTWNGTNKDGNAVLPGAYFVQLTAGEQIETYKILVAK